MKLGIDFTGAVFSALALLLGAPFVGVAGLLFFGSQMSVEWTQLWR